MIISWSKSSIYHIPPWRCLSMAFASSRSNTWRLSSLNWSTTARVLTSLLIIAPCPTGWVSGTYLSLGVIGTWTVEHPQQDINWHGLLVKIWQLTVGKNLSDVADVVNFGWTDQPLLLSYVKMLMVIPRPPYDKPKSSREWIFPYLVVVIMNKGLTFSCWFEFIFLQETSTRDLESGWFENAH